ncbi:uncharacterized protein J3R85_020890 [Psidium guajava]|nr:uncharacterized protein J3R85_020890 [Psidium guajava]
MSSPVGTRRRSSMTGRSIVAMLLMTLLLVESGPALGRVLLSGTNEREVAGFDVPGEFESMRVVASGADQRESNRALPTDRWFTLASGPSRKGAGH